MGILNYFNLGDAKYKALFSISTKEGVFRTNSTTGQLGFYDTKKDALADIKKRLPNTVGLFGTVGRATLFERMGIKKPVKWKKIAKYTIDLKNNNWRLKKL